MSKKELNFQKELKKHLENYGCTCLFNDPTVENGIPDLTILYGRKGLMIETKEGKNKLEITQEKYLEMHKNLLVLIITKDKNSFTIIEKLPPNGYEYFIIFNHFLEVIDFIIEGLIK